MMTSLADQLIGCTPRKLRKIEAEIQGLYYYHYYCNYFSQKFTLLASSNLRH